MKLAVNLSFGVCYNITAVQWYHYLWQAFLVYKLLSSQFSVPPVLCLIVSNVNLILIKLINSTDVTWQTDTDCILDNEN